MTTPASQFESDLRQLIARHENWPKAPTQQEMISVLQRAIVLLKRQAPVKR